MKNKQVKYILTLLPMLFLSLVAWANEDTGGATQQEGVMEWMLHNIVFIVAAIVILGAFIALIYVNNMLLQIQKVRLLQEHGIEAMEEVKLLDKESWWQRFTKSAWEAVPVEKEEDILFDHEYDGIRELDNVLPPWWVALFYITIFFGIGYLGYYHFSDAGMSSAEQYEMEMKEAQEAVEQYLASKADLVNESNVTALTDESELALGQSIFTTKCTPCHGQNGEGNAIGPNLTDEYWLHGGGIKNIFKTIKNGVPEKGMIAWGQQLRAVDIQRVASYVWSLQGTNPPNAKEPQGELWKPEEATEGAPAEGGAMGMK